MTTIAYKDKHIASDSKISDYDSMSATYMTKIFKISTSPSQTYLAGIVGDMYTGLIFLKWFQTGDQESKELLRGLSEDYAFEAMIVNEEGDIFVYNNFLEPLKLGKLPFYALGSGAKIAMALLDYGATIEATISYAKKYDMNTGGDIHVLSFD